MSSYLGDTKAASLSVGYGGSTAESADAAKLTVNGGWLQIHNYGNDLKLGSQNAGWSHIEASGNIYIHAGGDLKVNNSILPYSTLIFNLGSSSLRWGTLYASTVNTIYVSAASDITSNASLNAPFLYVDKIRSRSVTATGYGFSDFAPSLAAYGSIGSTYRYYKIANFAVPTGAETSLLLQGRVGGYTSPYQSNISCMITVSADVAGTFMSVLELGQQNSRTASGALYYSDIVLYKNTDGSYTAYFKCYQAFAFNVQATYTSRTQSSSYITFDRTYVTSVSGTLVAAASTCANALRVATNAAYVGPYNQSPTTSGTKLMTRSDVTSLINSLTTSSY